MIEQTIRNMFDEAGIQVNGKNPWDIQIHDKRFYKRVWAEKSLGLGESYMDGWWDCEQLDKMITKILTHDLDSKIKGNLKYALAFLPGTVFNMQSKLRSRIIADRHYDLGNDLFLSFLDPYLQYSCAFFQAAEEPAQLEQAQKNKLDLICKKLHLTNDDHLLDIGSGWGGLARYAAEQYGCTITGVNISQEQLKFSREFCEGLPVSFIDQDYRSMAGEYDKIVSVGMFEHVGPKNYSTFMKVVNKCLKDEGLFLLHTIGGNTTGANCDQWINKYIFPNGILPGLKQIAGYAEGLFIIEDVHNLGQNYDKTLLAWNRNFQKAWPELVKNNKQYDTRFKRMWEYFLLACAGSFRSRHNQVWQVVMAKYSAARRQLEFRV